MAVKACPEAEAPRFPLPVLKRGLVEARAEAAGQFGTAFLHLREAARMVLAHFLSRR